MKNGDFMESTDSTLEPLNKGTIMKKLIVAIVVLMTAGVFAHAQTATPKVTKRQIHQQQRIKEGVKSGELTKPEARRLEAREAKIQHDKRVAKSDGVVTPAERAKLAHEQNKASRRIYKQKHDAQTKK